MTEIRREWIDNAAALVRQEYPPILRLIEDYQAGADIVKWPKSEILINAFKGRGTRIEAVAKYIAETYDRNPVPKTEPRKRKPKTKAAEADKEVTDNG